MVKTIIVNTPEEHATLPVGSVSVRLRNWSGSTPIQNIGGGQWVDIGPSQTGVHSDFHIGGSFEFPREVFLPDEPPVVKTKILFKEEHRKVPIGSVSVWSEATRGDFAIQKVSDNGWVDIASWKPTIIPDSLVEQGYNFPREVFFPDPEEEVTENVDAIVESGPKYEFTIERCASNGFGIRPNFTIVALTENEAFAEAKRISTQSDFTFRLISVERVKYE